MPKVHRPAHQATGERGGLFVRVFSGQCLTYAAGCHLPMDVEDSKAQRWEIETSAHTAGSQWRGCV